MQSFLIRCGLHPIPSPTSPALSTTRPRTGVRGVADPSISVQFFLFSTPRRGLSTAGSLLRAKARRQMPSSQDLQQDLTRYVLLRDSAIQVQMNISYHILSLHTTHAHRVHLSNSSHLFYIVESE
jgi:hypothetical protein